MGYRSDVTYVFYTKYDQRNFSMLKLWFDENWPKQDFGEIETGDSHIMVRYEDVKWYDSYPEVIEVNKAIDRFIQTFETDSEASAKDQDASPTIPMFAYEYVRIGEEDNDIERDGSTWHDYRLSVSRTVYFN